MYSLGLVSLAALALASPIVRRQAPSGVPSYALTYAPIVYLHSEDPYRPSDIGAQLTHTQPEINFTVVSDAPNPLTLDNLNELNDDGTGGTNVYLTSKDNVQTNPTWLNGVTPNIAGETTDAVSCAIIVNDHGSGLVDIFYMYFYAFNWGGDYFGLLVDDHVGDWEHSMVRFQNGEPTAVWYSQHSNGEAFTYQAVEKWTDGLRPIVFSANGSHANYAITGTHDHTIPDVNLPAGPVEDFCDQGPVWDPTLSAYYYTYTPTSASSGIFAAYDDSTPVNWLYFVGAWGDQAYPESDPRQQDFLGISALMKYTSGPTGPEDKQLNRTQVCPDNGDDCILRVVLGP